MGAGSMIGEIAFFAGGARKADVRGFQSGFIALITTQHLRALFTEAPSTGAKVVHALGVSSLYQLTHNPRDHAPLAWNLRGAWSPRRGAKARTNPLRCPGGAKGAPA